MIRHRSLSSSVTSIRSVAIGLALSVSLALSGAGPAQTQVIDTRNQLVALSEAGRWDEARALAEAILAQSPNDVTALIVLSRALRAAGDHAGARQAARRAHAAARTDDERYAAATELAAAAYAMDRPLIAQIWLRRAVEVAPTPALRQSAIRNYRVVAAGNPLTVNLQFGIAPSSNVNNGSLAETVEIGGLDFTLNPDARALSGQELTAGFSLGYRLDGVGGLPARLSFAATMQEIRLSSSAKAAAPGLEADDYDYAGVELRFQQALNPTKDPLRWLLDLRLGRNWYGGDDLSTYAGAGLVASWGEAARGTNSVGLSVERQNRLDLDSRSATVVRLDAGRSWRLASGDQIALSGALRRTDSPSIEIDHDAALAAVTYDFGTVAGGMFTLSAGFGLEWRDYDRSPYRADGRDDLRARLTGKLGFPKAETYGFIPEISVEALHVNSTVDLYDSRDLGLRLGLRSAF